MWAAQSRIAGTTSAVVGFADPGITPNSDGLPGLAVVKTMVAPDVGSGRVRCGSRAGGHRVGRRAPPGQLLPGGVGQDRRSGRDRRGHPDRRVPPRWPRCTWRPDRCTPRCGSSARGCSSPPNAEPRHPVKAARTSPTSCPPSSRPAPHPWSCAALRTSSSPTHPSSTQPTCRSTRHGWSPAWSPTPPRSVPRSRGCARTGC